MLGSGSGGDAVQLPTPKKYEDVPTDILDTNNPSDYIVLLNRYKLIVDTTTQSFVVVWGKRQRFGVNIKYVWFVGASAVDTVCSCHTILTYNGGVWRIGAIKISGYHNVFLF